MPREIKEAAIVVALQHQEGRPLEVEYDTEHSVATGAIALTAVDDLLGPLLAIAASGSSGGMIALVRA